MELLTVREVATRLKVSPRHVFKLRSAGKLPVEVRVGRAVRWPEDQIIRWVRAGCPDRETFEQLAETAGGRN